MSAGSKLINKYYFSDDGSQVFQVVAVTFEISAHKHQIHAKVVLPYAELNDDSASSHQNIYHDIDIVREKVKICYKNSSFESTIKKSINTAKRQKFLDTCQCIIKSSYILQITSKNLQYELPTFATESFTYATLLSFRLSSNYSAFRDALKSVSTSTYIHIRQSLIHIKSSESMKPSDHESSSVILDLIGLISVSKKVFEYPLDDENFWGWDIPNQNHVYWAKYLVRLINLFDYILCRDDISGRIESFWSFFVKTNISLTSSYANWLDVPCHIGIRREHLIDSDQLVTEEPVSSSFVACSSSSVAISNDVDISTVIPVIEQSPEPPIEKPSTSSNGNDDYARLNFSVDFDNPYCF
jgi:hypothetical protein